MALSSIGLGKGLDALIRETSDSRPDSSNNQKLAIKDIVPNLKQPRKSFDENALAELAQSIRSQGLLQPILVRPIGPTQPGKYEIVAGERRWRASQMAGLTEVPVFIRSLSEEDTMIAALIENLQRENLNPMEEAIGLQHLKDEFDLSQDELAKKIGKSRPAIANSLRLLSLPESVRGKLTDGRLSAGHARTLLSLSTLEAQEKLQDIILKYNISVREAEGLVAIWKEKGSIETGDLEYLRTTQPEAKGLNLPHHKAHEGLPKRKPQSAKLLDIQHRISNIYKVPVRVTGKDDKGKISFSYNSLQELEAILAKMILDSDKG